MDGVETLAVPKAEMGISGLDTANLTNDALLTKSISSTNNKFNVNKKIIQLFANFKPSLRAPPAKKGIFRLKFLFVSTYINGFHMTWLFAKIAGKVPPNGGIEFGSPNAAMKPI
jgi:hypothetical protein